MHHTMHVLDASAPDHSNIINTVSEFARRSATMDCNSCLDTLVSSGCAMCISHSEKCELTDCLQEEVQAVVAGLRHSDPSAVSVDLCSYYLLIFDK